MSKNCRILSQLILGHFAITRCQKTTFECKKNKNKNKKNNKYIVLWKANLSSPVGLEPPTFRLTAERANRLRHGDTSNSFHNCTELLHEISRLFNVLKISRNLSVPKSANSLQISKRKSYKLCAMCALQTAKHYACCCCFFMFLAAKVLVVFVSQPVSLPRRSGHNILVSYFPRWIAMSTVVSCPNSLVSFFPATISKSFSDVDVLPELIASLDRSKPPTVQFLCNGTVCITFKDTAPCNDVAPL